jgi:mannose-6-phosphate isomerase-like protein (cupin superfamily)
LPNASSRCASTNRPSSRADSRSGWKNGSAPLRVIEVQRGEYLDEEDIVRIDDC